ncbi:hypothetical protein CPC735_033700 [Coccidioides posadasii C735 delta SOWgp]|uniref:Uncharacterized protein n=1 Tax=Coccidioides posadasii (strain C735) TaxID=222929 RepID=C5P5P4_COCP7|nr:hypothetical protein CPC735_033700 [Coccidioides posadasii C735 delta SOWgp]EER28034.1 hypothetical protein CPC735_033700 [Coccidioides posadasii C735 delta SOWgp]|eukprot:XP_003070179.1 hypothetical protein CPC735_033700 [Coccidioides posadasii C735 delta SOWgp]
MNPYLRWAILLLVAGGLAYYYRKGSPKPKSSSIRSSLEKTDQSLSTKKLKQRKPKKAPEATNTSGSPTPTPQPQPQPGVAPATTSAAADEGMSNLEFAKQFSKVREGNAIATGTSKKATPAPQPVSRPMTGGSDAPGSTSASSSMTGGDADDDLSPIGSPVIKPAGDVSDMLEAPAPGASVLRLTGSIEDEQKAKKKTKKSDGFKPAETKKQRQQRIKRENNKRMVQEAETQRRALLEKQLHTAREHERQEAAKSKPPTSNAWAPTALMNGVKKTESSPAALLDTFEPGTKDATLKSKDNNNNKGSAAAPRNWTDDLPSEEEQIRLLSAMSSENEWTTVSNKKRDRRRANNPGGAMSDTSTSDAQVVKPEPEPVVKSRPHVEEKTWTEQGHPLDSEWAA